MSHLTRDNSKARNGAEIVSAIPGIARQDPTAPHTSAGNLALQRLAEAAQQHSGQARHIRRLLLALYNGPEWPFEMNRLLALDLSLQEDALAVIRLVTLSGREIHTYLPNGNDLMVALWEREEAR